MTIKYFKKDVEQYTRSLRALSRHTVANYQTDLGRFVAFISRAGCKTWLEVDEKTARQYLVACRESGLLGRSISRHLSALRGLFRWLKKEKMIFNNPFFGLKAPKSKSRLPEVLDVDQMSYLLSRKADSALLIRDKAMFELMYGCGLRVSELTFLNVGDVYLDYNELRVTGKGRKERLLPLGREAKTAILKWLPVRERFMNRLENEMTVVSAMHITSATLIFVVTANAEQIPSICNPIGLLLKIGLTRISLTSDTAFNLA